MYLMCLATQKTDDPVLPAIRQKIYFLNTASLLTEPVMNQKPSEWETNLPNPSSSDNLYFETDPLCNQKIKVFSFTNGAELDFLVTE